MALKKLLYLICFSSIICSIAAEQVNRDVAWGPSKEGCRISLATDKAEYNFGQPIGLHVLMENQDRSEVPLVADNPLPFHVQIWGPQNSEVPLTLWGKSLTRTGAEVSNVVVMLAKGKTKNVDFGMLNEAYDMTLPGKYAIVVSWNLPSETDPSAWITLFSNTVIIDVKPFETGT